MTNIYNVDTNEVVEIDGVNYLDDVMGNAGIDTIQPYGDSAWMFALPTDEIEWWERWSERQELIDAAMEDADEATQERCRNEPEWSDMEAAQDTLMGILGLVDFGIR